MRANKDGHQAFDVPGLVRRNAGPAAFAAVLMLYFGFGRLTEPAGTDLFARSNWVFYHTIRFGGVAMGAIAVWAWIGHRPALVVDAVVSVVIGILFILSAAGMLIDGGGFENGLYALFGVMFISAGARNGRTFLRTSGAPRALARADRMEHATGRASPGAPEPGPENTGRDSAPAETAAPAGPPPEGYLAALARKHPPE